MKAIKIYRAGLHLGEEKGIDGNQNSGMVNFSGCHLNCHFCYTPETSKEWQGREITGDEFSELCDDLVKRGARNLNLISPTPYFAALVKPLERIQYRYAGLLPVILKVSGYESLPQLDSMIPLTDVFVPDFKVWDETLAHSVGLPQRYGVIALAAIEKMMATHGAAQLTDTGKIRRGLLIRHLLMPGAMDDSFEIISQLARIGYRGHLNLMSYFYDPKAKRVTNAPLHDISLLARHADSAGMTVWVNGKVPHPYVLACRPAAAELVPRRAGGSHGH